MRVNLKVLILVLVILAINYSCNDFLAVEPRGVFTDDSYPNTKDGAEQLLIGAYSMLDGYGNFGGPNLVSATNWLYGSITGGDAHKGSEQSDQPPINEIEKYSALPTNYYFDFRWSLVYEGVARANAVLRLLKKVTDATTQDTTRIGAEARGLRGIYHLEAKRLWNLVPFIYENSNPDVAKNDQNIWPEIEADFMYAFNQLPEESPDVGRLTKWSARAFYGKVLMYQGKYSQAKSVLEEVYTQGKNPSGIKYALMPKFSDNFDPSKDNNSESVFAIQYSVNDGSGPYNGRAGDYVTFPQGEFGQGPFGCCGFFQPSSELVNSYRTDANGLPLLDGSYNEPGNELKDDQGIESYDVFVEDSGNLDPRLDWTVGRRGIPYLDWGDHPGKDWIRSQSYGGPYSTKKNIYSQANKEQYTDHTDWTGGVSTAANYTMIRFSDVILWLAECEVEADNLAAARNYVNEVRFRATNPADWVKNADGTDAAKYVISPYPGSGAPFDTKENARRAVHFERKLELAMEGHRFFDLVRWGEAATTLNAYLQYESTKRSYLKDANFKAGQSEYYPVPQHQIDLMGADILQQNPGY